MSSLLSGEEPDTLELGPFPFLFSFYQKAALGGQSASFWESVMAMPGWRALHTSPYVLPPPSSGPPNTLKHPRHKEVSPLPHHADPVPSPGCLLQRFPTGLGQRSALERVKSQPD